MEPASKKIVSLDDLEVYPVSFLLELSSASSDHHKIMTTFDEAVIKLHGKAHLFVRNTTQGSSSTLSRMYGSIPSKILELDSKGVLFLFFKFSFLSFNIFYFIFLLLSDF